jgi:hypothetical protein
MRDVGVISTLSLGWNLGTIRDFGGAGIDTAKALKNLAAKQPAELTDKMVFTPIYVANVMAIGGILTYLFTGNPPEETLDYFYPPTGRTNSDGSKERRLIPAMTKDYFSMKEAMRKEGVKGVATKWGVNKLSPVFHDFASLVNNKDFFGVEIRNPDDPFMKQTYDNLQYVLRNSLPFAVQSYKKEKQRHGKGSVLPFLGLSLAPGYVTKDNIQKEIYDLIGKRFTGVKKREEFEKIEKKRELENLYRNKKYNEFRELSKQYLKDRVLTLRQVQNITRKASMPSDAYLFNMLAEDDKIKLIKKMNDKQRVKYLKWAKGKTRYLFKKVENAGKER